MTATQNNLLGPAALIFSCCFPAKSGWDSEICGLGASHEFAQARPLPAEDCEVADKTLFDRIRRGRAIIAGGPTVLVY
jgi:hypothetical protein